MDAASGERRFLVASDKLESILPVDASRLRRPPALAAARLLNTNGR